MSAAKSPRRFRFTAEQLRELIDFAEVEPAFPAPKRFYTRSDALACLAEVGLTGSIAAEVLSAYEHQLQRRLRFDTPNPQRAIVVARHRSTSAFATLGVELRKQTPSR